MKTHNLIQGSPEWLAHRAQYKNASDSPAVMGESKYKTRSQLLAGRHSGIAPEIDAGTQRLFDDGHRFEALARPLAEKIIGEGLSPITGTDGEFGASFDGITFGGEIIWEHKSLNDDIRKVQFGDNLPLMYRIQMEHQLMVSGAERCLFSATKWDGEMPVEEIHVWYVPDLDLRARIVAAWEQFDKDLAAYVPQEVIPAAVAAPIADLPTISFEMNGAALSTNLHKDVKPVILALVEKSKKPLETDQDFADLAALCKKFKKAEEQCEVIAAQVDAKFIEPDKFKKDLKELREIMAAARIAGEKRVSTEKESRKAAIADKARVAFNAHFIELEKEITPIRLIAQHPDFGGAMRGLKNLSAMEEAVDNALRNGKYEADLAAKDIRAKLAWFREFSAYEFLFRDMQQVIQKPLDDFQLTVTARIEAHKNAEEAKLDAERQRIQAEEEAKAREKVLEKLAAAQVQQHSESLRVAIKQAVTNGEAAVKTCITESGSLEVSVHDIRPPSPPSRAHIIEAVALAFGVAESTAADWLVKEFQQRAA